MITYNKSHYLDSHQRLIKPDGYINLKGNGKFKTFFSKEIMYFIL